MTRIVFFIFIILFLIGCAGKTNFMGADKYIGGGSFVERWYLKPEYKKEDIPKGTAFYGASANKIKDRFDIKYYQKTEDGKDDIFMPKKDLWTIKHNGKEFYEQDDDKLFYYVKRGNGFVKKLNKNGKLSRAIYDSEELLAVKECYFNGMCKLYPDIYETENIYIYKSILDKPLSEINE